VTEFPDPQKDEPISDIIRDVFELAEAVADSITDAEIEENLAVLRARLHNDAPEVEVADVEPNDAHLAGLCTHDVDDLEREAELEYSSDRRATFDIYAASQRFAEALLEAEESRAQARQLLNRAEESVGGMLTAAEEEHDRRLTEAAQMVANARRKAKEILEAAHADAAAVRASALMDALHQEEHDHPLGRRWRPRESSMREGGSFVAVLNLPALVMNHYSVATRLPLSDLAAVCAVEISGTLRPTFSDAATLAIPRFSTTVRRAFANLFGRSSPAANDEPQHVAEDELSPAGVLVAYPPELERPGRKLLPERQNRQSHVRKFELENVTINPHKTDEVPIG
jgi:hypothetical protein